MKISEEWNQEESDYIREKVIAHNMNFLPPEVKHPLKKFGFILKDSEGSIKGGITGTMFWYHLHIDFLWVDQSIRHQGFGKELLRRLEAAAEESGCRLILLDTFSFQAPGFYQKYGYSITGKVEDHPKGFCQYFLEKRTVK
ncbi:GNAT family N-acetyltransferase [Peribacillus kribbensis]|uniref:GNAT family N-acetyltransferase n=1 Tax=Peribacillus kribbensis TaxID=356658 RepID=UPI0004074DD3|nr:GNAT family N-acetyltransferase [Peribacillus kribbensis]